MKMSVLLLCEKYWLFKSLQFLQKVHTFGEKSRLFKNVSIFILWKVLSFAESVDMTLSMLLLFMMMKGAMPAKFSKIVNFQLSNWGRILLEDHWCYQSQSNSIIWRSMVSRDISRLNQSAELILLYIVPVSLLAGNCHNWILPIQPQKCWLLKSLYFLQKVQTFGEKSGLLFKSHYF